MVNLFTLQHLLRESFQECLSYNCSIVSSIVAFSLIKIINHQTILYFFYVFFDRTVRKVFSNFKDSLFQHLSNLNSGNFLSSWIISVIIGKEEHEIKQKVWWILKIHGKRIKIESEYCETGKRKNYKKRLRWPVCWFQISPMRELQTING